jgi:hypothetical protein
MTEHPEVMKWTYLRSYGDMNCSQSLFGFDPFPAGAYTRPLLSSI